MFRVFSTVLTLAIIVAFWKWLADYIHLFIVIFLWFKLVSNTGIWYLTRKAYKAQFWFYHNLGLSETDLFCGAFTLDLLIASLLIFSSYQLRLVL